jgi:NAD(P)-dependent dehydrogenase (short-subunit alcohol dehydrogenase family)
VDLNLEGKVALVTGASRGIGFAIARAYVDAGAKVMICARGAENLGTAAAEIDDEVAWRVANASDESAAAATVQATIDRFGRLDVLVNNAATNPYFGPLMGINAKQMAKTVDVNVRAAVTWSQLVWEASMRENGGVIVNIASIGGFSIEADIGYYNASKAALMQLTRQLAFELAPDVRVVGIAPGLVKTDMASALWRGREEEFGEGIPRGRLGEPADIGAAALFLSSSAADWITGTTVVVDGGQHLSPLSSPRDALTVTLPAPAADMGD